MKIGDRIPVKYRPEWRTLVVTVTEIFEDGSFVAITSPGHKSRFTQSNIVSHDGLMRCTGGCGYWYRPNELFGPISDPKYSPICHECAGLTADGFKPTVSGVKPAMNG